MMSSASGSVVDQCCTSKSGSDMRHQQTKANNNGSNGANENAGGGGGGGHVKFKFLDEKEKWFCVEAHKHSLSKMIVIMSISFIFGHFLFTVCGISLQIMYFNYYGFYLNIYYEKFVSIKFFMALSNIMYYISISSNIFIYLYYSQLFKSIFMKLMKQLNENTLEKIFPVRIFS
jgi:hypothetical protein